MFDDKITHFTQLEAWKKNPDSNLDTRLVIEMIIESGSTGINRSKAMTTEKLEVFKKIADLWKQFSNEQQCLLDVLSVAASRDIFLDDVYKKLSELKKLSEGRNTPLFLEKMATYIHPWTSPQTFLDGASKVMSNTDRAKNSSAPTVRVLSFQSSKGLEAAYVFIVGLEEGAVPRSSSTNIAEEARLLFVAMTRAKKQLHLFHCRKRSGSVTLRKFAGSLSKSRFLSHLPDTKKRDQYHQSKSAKKGASLVSDPPAKGLVRAREGGASTL